MSTNRLKGWSFIAKPDPKSTALFKTRLDEIRPELEEFYESHQGKKGRLIYQDLEILIDKVMRQTRINTENMVKDEVFLAFWQQVSELHET